MNLSSQSFLIFEHQLKQVNNLNPFLAGVTIVMIHVASDFYRVWILGIPLGDDLVWIRSGARERNLARTNDILLVVNRLRVFSYDKFRDINVDILELSVFITITKDAIVVTAHHFNRMCDRFPVIIRKRPLAKKPTSEIHCFFIILMTRVFDIAIKEYLLFVWHWSMIRMNKCSFGLC